METIDVVPGRQTQKKAVLPTPATHGEPALIRSCIPGVAPRGRS
jgi:hypothetical protein